MSGVIWLAGEYFCAFRSPLKVAHVPGVSIQASGPDFAGPEAAAGPCSTVAPCPAGTVVVPLSGASEPGVPAAGCPAAGCSGAGVCSWASAGAPASDRASAVEAASVANVAVMAQAPCRTEGYAGRSRAGSNAT